MPRGVEQIAGVVPGVDVGVVEAERQRGAARSAGGQIGEGDGVELRPGRQAALPRDLELVLRIGLAADPADRFASAGDLRDAFAAALDARLPAPIRRRGTELLGRAPWA